MNPGEGAGRGSIFIQNETLRRGFTSTPNRVLCNAALSMGARFVYTLLLSYAWQDDRCFPGQERLARDVGCSVRTVQRYLAELEEAEEIQIIQQGLQRPNIYVILDRRSDTTPLSRQGATQMSDPVTTPPTRPEPTKVSHPDATGAPSTEATGMAHDKRQNTRRKHRETDPTGGRLSTQADSIVENDEVSEQVAGRLSDGDKGARADSARRLGTDRLGRQKRVSSPHAAAFPLNGASHNDGQESASLLRAEGVSPAKAALLTVRYSRDQIIQQIAWLDGRRYADRAACLVAAIEGNYGPPSPRRSTGPDSAAVTGTGLPINRELVGAEQKVGRSSSRYTGGSYGVCPVCLSSPCDADCPMAGQR